MGGGSLIQEPVTSPDEVEEVAQVSAEVGSRGGVRDILGCLGQASLKLRDDLQLEQDLLEVQVARGGGPHSLPRKLRLPSAHLQLRSPVWVQRSSFCLYSLLASLPGISDLMLMVRLLVPAKKAALNLSLKQRAKPLSQRRSNRNGST